MIAAQQNGNRSGCDILSMTPKATGAKMDVLVSLRRSDSRGEPETLSVARDSFAWPLPPSSALTESESPDD